MWRGLYSSYGGSEHLNGVIAIEDLYDDFGSAYILKKVLSVKNSIDCTACPLGATCNYKLRSRGNFYGFFNKNRKYKFINCPTITVVPRKELHASHTIHAMLTVLVCFAEVVLKETTSAIFRINVSRHQSA